MSQMLDFDDNAARAMEAMYLTPDVVGQRAKVIEMLAPAPGEHVLDIGVGPGLLAYDMARMVGEGGRLAGLDASAAMLKVARTRLAALPQAECIQGDATELRFPDESFDIAVSTQVHEYVADMGKALKELHRVVKPGGRALILDTDWRSVVWHSSDQARMDRVLLCWDDHLADPHLPATLGAGMRKAGFGMLRVEIVPMLSPQWQPVSYAAGIMKSIRGYAMANGERHGLSGEEVQAWYDDQLRLAERGEFFFSVNRYAFLGVRQAAVEGP
ncbi:methyltransferase domain-containing protein [Parvibaculum sp.]|jgi:arsenite methyltransferase|uniref:methyltransferase domain-containing protein n=1 Tax=Parvibaculum sp. TaxID=2024848 RepID=UPI000C5A6DEF|nr:methyltransferase domain-containing protein [Parvibaculum sp.]MAM94266.1 methyltransferase type 11 [Parvibaculum sp.]|tara:strand:+ start:6506 stop:7318 length:813 start_codon:yes stop_codon:yes gene_type:complete